MNDDMNTTNNQVPTPPQVVVNPPPTPSFALVAKGNGMSKGILVTLVVIIALAVGIGSGYFWSNMSKANEIDAAKTTAKADALKSAASDLAKAKAEAKQKTSTNTTCNADELSMTLGASSGSGAGTLAYNLAFTNISKRTCILTGFPDVSLVNVNGNQVGTPADHASNYTEKDQTLAPNAKAKATVSVSNSANFSDGQCKAGVTRLRVYPPNDVGYISVGSPVNSWCPGFTVSPILAA